jgi:hypothetical protein
MQEIFMFSGKLLSTRTATVVMATSARIVRGEDEHSQPQSPGLR